MRNYHNLSPVDFEELVRDLLQKDLGISLESFGPGADRGIDLRYAHGGDRIIIQAKRYLDSTFSTLMRELRTERDKIERLKPTRYILAIAKTLTPPQKDKVLAIFEGLPLEVADIKTLREIDVLLDRFPDVEKAHFKLWLTSVNILERIIYAGIYNRTRAEIAEIEELIPKFVGSSGISQAETILQKERILIISGEPGVGKSSLARFLISAHARQNWKIVVIDKIEQAFDITTADENTLVFFDDFLGQVELTPDFLRGMDAQLPTVFRDIQRRKTLRFILTTRSYILRQARYKAGRLADNEFKPTEFVLKIGHYSRAERARILYNHLYFSNIATPVRNSLLDGNLVISIIDHKNFNPRLIKVLTSPKYINLEQGSLSQALLRVLDNPQELWAIPYRQHLNAESRALLIALFINAPQTALNDLTATFERILPIFAPGISPPDVPSRFRQSLHELEGSFLSIGNRMVGFANPGVRDFLTTVVRQDGLSKLLLPIVATYIEVQTLWQVQRAHLPSLQSRHDEYKVLFAEALVRCEGDNSLDVLAQIDLSLNIYAEFGGEAFSTQIEKIANDIPNWGFDDKDIPHLRNLSVAISRSKLPEAQLGTADAQILKAAEAILNNDAVYFNFDDVQQLIGLVREYEDLPVETAAAVKGFLERWLSEDINSELETLFDTDDIDQFETAVDEMLVEFGANAPNLPEQLAARREALLEEEDVSSQADDYRPTPETRDLSISDKEIHSMFAALRNDEA